MKFIKIAYLVVILYFTANNILFKWSSSGTKQWANTDGDWSVDLDGMGVVATDSSGNIYTTGSFSGELDGNTSSGESDIFLVMYNSSGTKQWTKHYGTSASESV